VTPLRRAVEDYIGQRQAMGFKFTTQAAELRGFAEFAKKEHARRVTTDLALRWAMRSARAQPSRWGRRLGVIRQFAEFMRPLDPRTVVPPPDLLPGDYERKPPHIYSHGELDRLLDAARRRPSRTGLRGASYSTLLALLWVTGLRLGEALRLDDDDFDESEGVLTIRESKFGKSRLVPLHASTTRALRRYMRLRNRLCPARSSAAFFVGKNGRRFDKNTVQQMFRVLRCEAGLSTAAGRRQPRLLDFRHTLAVRTLIRWYRCGADVEQRLPALSTYLGHTHQRDTYWYFSSVPELMNLVAKHSRSTR
jgi:integrase